MTNLYLLKGTSPAAAVLESGTGIIDTTTAADSGSSNDLDVCPVTGRIAIAKGASAYLYVLDPSDLSVVHSGGSAAIFGVAWSPDGAYLAVALQASPYLIVYDTSDWSTVTLAATLSYACSDVAWSPDGTRLVAAYGQTTKSIFLIDTADWSHIVTPNPPFADAGQSVAVSSTHVAVCTPVLKILTLSTLTWVSFSSFAAAAGAKMSFSPDEAYLAVPVTSGSNPFNYLRIVPAGSWASAVSYTAVLTGSGKFARFSPDGTLLAAGQDGSPYFRVLNFPELTANTSYADAGFNNAATAGGFGVAATESYDYDATPDRTTVAPGQTVTVDFETTDDDGTYYYEITGTSTVDDIVGSELTGSFTVTSGVGSFDIEIEPAATGGRTIIVEIALTEGGAVVDTAETVTITLPTIEPDQTDIDEGDTATWTVTGPDGEYKYALNTGASDAGSADIDLSGFGTVVVSGGTGTISIDIIEDFTTEGAEDLVIDLWDFSESEILGTADAVTINDTSNSTGVDFTITASDTSVNEGDIITLTATSSVMPPSGLLYYAVTGVANNADFDFGQNEIEMEPDGFGGAVGTVVVTVSLDETFEGTETCTFKLRTGGVSGPDVAATATITIGDTSIPAASYYLLMGSSDVEGGSEPGTLFVNWVTTGTGFYWEISADSYMVAADFDGGVTSGTFTNSIGDFEGSEGNFSVEIAADNLTEVHPWDTGTATSATAASLTDTSKSWATDQQANKLCVIVGGTATGERNLVASNTADTLSFAEAWEVTPDDTSEYRLEEWFRVLVYRGSDNTGLLVADSGIVLIDDTSLTPPTFTVTGDKTLVPEGLAVEVDATATNFTGDTLYYELVGTANGADFVGGSSGSFAVAETTYPGKAGSTTITVAQDESIEGLEYFTINLKSSPGGPTVASFGPIYIADEQYTVTPNFRQRKETETVIFTAAAINSNPSATLYWLITGSVIGADFTVTDLSGSVTLSGGLGYITKTLADDATADGIDYFRVELYRDAGHTELLAVSGAVIVRENAVDYDEFDTTLGGVRILLVEMQHSAGWVYFSNYPYVSYPGDTNPHRGYAEDLSEVVNIESRIDGALVVGETSIVNDGEYDYLIDLDWAGYRTIYLEGRPEWSLDDFRQVAIATNGGIDTVEPGLIVWASYDTMADFDIPLVTDYLADGRIAPFALGKPFNVPAILIDQADHEYKVNADFVTVTPRVDGEDVISSDTPGTGTFELTAQPLGNVAADLETSVTTVDGAVALLCTMAGVAADSATVGSLPAYEIGIWHDSVVSVHDVLMEVCQSVGAFPVRGADGELEAYVLTVPAVTPDYTLDYQDDIAELQIRCLKVDQPASDVTVYYNRNWAPASHDTLGAVLTADPDFAESLTRQWSHVTVTNTLSGFPLAKPLEVYTYLVSGTDAAAEAARIAALRDVKRFTWQVEAYMPFAYAKVGKTVEIIYPGFGFESGANARIISVSRALTEGRVILEVWL